MQLALFRIVMHCHALSCIVMHCHALSCIVIAHCHVCVKRLLRLQLPGVGIALRLLGEAGVLQENFGQVQALVNVHCTWMTS